jgi:ketosteroid isomerase-like protein
MGDSDLVGEALCDSVNGGHAVGDFMFMPGWHAVCLALIFTVGCSQQACPELAAHPIPASAPGVHPVSLAPDVQDFLARHREATIRMLNGDVTSWLALASHSDEATLFPPFGGVERGWDQVGPRYEAVAANFRAQRHSDAILNVELISSGVSGDLAYIVTFERGRVYVGEDREPRTWLTRVTHILRREQGTWVLMHRHMDHLPDQYTPPGQ